MRVRRRRFGGLQGLLCYECARFSPGERSVEGPNRGLLTSLLLTVLILESRRARSVNRPRLLRVVVRHIAGVHSTVDLFGHQPLTGHGICLVVFLCVCQDV